MTARGYRRFCCRECGRQFNERSGGVLNRTCLPSDIIAFVVFCRLRYRLAAQLGNTGRATAVLSLEDFYLTRNERAQLGRDIDPMFATRGVPGTHDVTLAQHTIAALVAGIDKVAAPSFDKTSDDRAPAAAWPRIALGVQVVIFEGWCVGARDAVDGDLVAPINALERDEDPDGRWRGHVNAALRDQYRALFDGLDIRVLLRAPDFA